MSNVNQSFQAAALEGVPIVSGNRTLIYSPLTGKLVGIEEVVKYADTSSPLSLALNSVEGVKVGAPRTLKVTTRYSA